MCDDYRHVGVSWSLGTLRITADRFQLKLGPLEALEWIQCLLEHRWAVATRGGITIYISADLDPYVRVYRTMGEGSEVTLLREDLSDAQLHALRDGGRKGAWQDVARHLSGAILSYRGALDTFCGLETHEPSAQECEALIARALGAHHSRRVREARRRQPGGSAQTDRLRDACDTGGVGVEAELHVRADPGSGTVDPRTENGG